MGVAVINIILWCLDVTLVAFHSYLCWAGITTYEYLTGKVTKNINDARRSRGLVGYGRPAGQAWDAADGLYVPSGSESDEDVGTGFGAIFRPLIAQDGDLTLRKVVSS